MSACFALLLACATAPQRDDLSVAASQRDGQWWCTISATRAPLRELVDSLSLRMGLDAQGLDAIPDGARVTVELRERPAQQVLARALGSIGMAADLRTHSLRVRTLSSEELDSDELFELALAAHARALRDFPDHPGSANARLAQARIEEARGNADAALVHYEALFQRNQDSLLMPEALMGCGRLQMAHGEWAAAGQRFADLLRLDRRHDFEIPARLALARCAAQLGDHERAFYMLDVVDTYAPTMDPAQTRERLLIRARAQIAAGKAPDALETLEAAQRLARRESLPPEALELRARALEATGDGAAACKAWLAFAHEADEDARSDAYAQAARLAADSGDALAALFLAEEARGHGTKDPAVDLRERLLKELELGGGDARERTAAERLDRAERLISAGLAEEARPVLAELYLARKELAEDALLRTVCAYAGALAETEGIDAAVTLLREALPDLSGDEARRRVYVRAGEILEEHGRFGQAAEAYQGRL